MALARGHGTRKEAWHPQGGMAPARGATTMSFPLPKRCWGVDGMQEPPGGDNVFQAAQTSPNDLDAWFAITLASQEASQACKPGHGLVQGRRLLWDGGCLMHGRI